MPDPGPKTTKQDLANMGFDTMKIWNTLNAVREGTLQVVHLNDKFCDNYQWYLYNILLGDPVKVGERPIELAATSTRFHYDNTQSDEPFSQEWNEQWTNESSADLTITGRANINLHASVSLLDLISAGWNLQIDTEATDAKHQSKQTVVQTVFTVDVHPHEEVSLLRTRTDIGIVCEYEIPYGFKGSIGTTGKKWRDHWDWSIGFNSHFGNPQGNMRLQATSVSTEWSFTIVRNKVQEPGASPAEVSPKSTLSYVDPETGEKKVLACGEKAVLSM